jgi:hypothetical protein
MQRSTADPRKRMTEVPADHVSPRPSTRRPTSPRSRRARRVRAGTAKNTATFRPWPRNATTRASNRDGDERCSSTPGPRRTSNTRRIAGPSTSEPVALDEPVTGAPRPVRRGSRTRQPQGIAVTATTAVTTPSAGQALRHSRADATREARGAPRKQDPSRFVSTIRRGAPSPPRASSLLPVEQPVEDEDRGEDEEDVEDRSASTI